MILCYWMRIIMNVRGSVVLNYVLPAIRMKNRNSELQREETRGRKDEFDE